MAINVISEHYSEISPCVLLQSNDLLWEDYEQKFADQAIRSMENYLAQFNEIKVWIQGFPMQNPVLIKEHDTLKSSAFCFKMRSYVSPNEDLEINKKNLTGLSLFEHRRTEFQMNFLERAEKECLLCPFCLLEHLLFFYGSFSPSSFCEV